MATDARPGPVRRRSRRSGDRSPARAAIGLTVLLAGSLVDEVELSAFSGTTGTAATWGTDTLDPPTGFSAARPCGTAAGAPTLVGTTSAATTSTSVAVAKPTGVAAGDLLLAFAYSSDNSNPPTGPSGWTQIESQIVSGLGIAGRVFSKTAGGSEPASYTFGGFGGAADDGAVIISAWTDMDATPIDVHGSAQGSSSTVTAPSVTIGASASRLLVALMPRHDTDLPVPSGMTALDARISGASKGTLELYEETRSASGATGTRSAAAGASGDWVAFSVAIRGAVPDPTVTLTWTATPDTYATGYSLTRTPGSTTAISGRTTVTSTDSTTTATTAYSYSLRTVYGSWTSTAATASVTAC